MKNKKFYLMLFILILHATALFSQQRSGADATLGSTKNENGSANISYNLYTIENGNIQVPITLYYTGSRGIKVNEIASWVGLGWQLDAGGYISRIVQGYPDDEYKGQEKKEGILFNNNLSVIEPLNTAATNPTQINDIVKKDFEPDIFIIKTGSMNASFLFDKNKVPRCIENPNLKISFAQNNDGKIISFTVIDENGLKYFFNESSQITENTPFENPKLVVNDKEDVQRTYNSTWVLTKIIDISQNSVDFIYKEENTSYSINKLEKVKVCKYNDCNNYPTVQNYDFRGNTSISGKNRILDKIVTSKGQNIIFSTSTRDDLTGGQKLSGFSVDNKINYSFTQSYFTSDSGSSPNALRLKLDAIILNGLDYLEFRYDSKTLPVRQSFEQDYWGYYNKNGANTLIPKVYIDENATDNKSFVDYGYENFNTSGYLTLSGADRRSNMNAEACILKEIINQYKGKKLFEYELNDFIYKNKKIIGNGLRIKKVIDKNDNINYQTTYSYKTSNNLTSGNVISLPGFSYIANWMCIRYIKDQEYYQEQNNIKYRVYLNGLTPVFENQGSANWSLQEKYDITTMRYALPVNSLYGDYSVFYSYITEESDYYKGKKINLFDVPVYNETLTDGKHSYGANSYNSNYYSNVSNDKELGDLPYKPNSISRKNSIFLKESKIIDVNNITLNNTLNSYSNSNSNSFKIVGLKYSPLEGGNPFGMLSIMPFWNFYHLISKYNLIDNEEKNLFQSVNTEYLNGASVQKVKSFEYNNKNYISKEKWVDIDGNSFENRITYACDYNVSGTPSSGSSAEAIQFMNTNNILQAPIEKVLIKNGKVISGEINIYKKINNTVKLTEAKKLEVGDLNTTHQYASINGSNLQIDQRYTTQEYYDLYDSLNGNLLQKHNENGILTSYIYGYNGRYLVATLINVPFSSIPITILNSISTTTDETTLKNLFTQLRNQFPDGRISTTTYIPSIGKKSETNENGMTIFYEYDAYNRLEKELNTDNKIIKKYKYNYAPKTYYNSERSGNFMKYCDGNGIGTTFTYTVAPNTYTSIISQADADQKAQDDVNSNGQNAANNNPNGTCTPFTCNLSFNSSIGISGGGSVSVTPTSYYKISFGFSSGSNSVNLPWNTGVTVATISGTCKPTTEYSSYNGQVYYTIKTNGDIILKTHLGTIPPNNTSYNYDLFFPIN
jgi:hypothetical protein